VSGPRPSIAVTAGEPAGIGPELCAMLAARHAAQPFAARIVVLGDRGLLDERARRIGIEPGYADFRSVQDRASGDAIEVWNVPLVVRAQAGLPDPANAAHVIDMLERACDACATGVLDAMTTAPVQKSAILDAGIPFTGHTEFLAARTHTPRVVMMLSGGDASAPLRVALVTTHLPLKDVAAAITREAVVETLVVVDRALRTQFGIGAPSIAVCGLNPHAGEGGYLGSEDRDAIAPAIRAAVAAGIDAHGPFPADTIFVPQHARAFDAIVAMYHDQGLPVLKAASFGGGVNVTLGLPFPRTSVDHGTALDLAADGARARTADPGSLLAAVDVAIELAARRA
jgi:4-hydroxythreonine-4-phosphate dehydrogenase